jgi:hypothetical protein
MAGAAEAVIVQYNRFSGPFLLRHRRHVRNIPSRRMGVQPGRQFGKPWGHQALILVMIVDQLRRERALSVTPQRMRQDDATAWQIHPKFPFRIACMV